MCLSLGDGEKPRSCLEAFKLAECFPNIRTLLHILSVAPITSATAERSFSALRRIKTYLRSNMGEERLNGLALVHINNDYHVNHDDVLADFSVKNKRRLQFDL